MGLSYRIILDQYLAAPAPTARERQRSAALPPRRRDGLLSVASLRRVSFASPSPEARTALRGGDASSLARRSRALDALAVVVASTQDVLAAQAHVAAHKGGAR